MESIMENNVYYLPAGEELSLETHGQQNKLAVSLSVADKAFVRRLILRNEALRQELVYHERMFRLFMGGYFCTLLLAAVAVW